MGQVHSRCIALFHKKNNELHHTGRYKKHPKIKVYLYNAENNLPPEKELAQKLVIANALNFMSNEYSIDFLGQIDEIREMRICE